MRGLVRIDRTVLDKNLRPLGNGGGGVRFDQRSCGFGARKARVDISGSGDFQTIESIYFAETSNDLFRDLAGRLAQTLRQFEREWQGVLAELDFGWLLNDDCGQVEPVLLLEEVANSVGKQALEIEIQVTGIPVSC